MNIPQDKLNVAGCKGDDLQEATLLHPMLQFYDQGPTQEETESA